MVIILIGVSGCGKTVVGQQLAAKLGATFYDGDDYHPPANVEKMRQSVPLNDADRKPWIANLAGMVDGWLAANEPAILACSGLKRWIREALGEGREGVKLVHLNGSKELIAGRLAERKHRYMPADLLDSQFKAFEPIGEDEGVIDVSIDGSVDEIVESIVAAVKA